MFVAKLNAAGNALLYSTYLGRTATVIRPSFYIWSSAAVDSRDVSAAASEVWLRTTARSLEFLGPVRRPGSAR